MQRRKMAPPRTPSLTLLLFQLLSTLPFTTLALHFHHVNLHDLTTGHRPPDATPQSHHPNPHKLSLDLLHRDSLPGRNHSTLHHRLIRDSHRVSFLLRRLGGATAGYHPDDFGSDVVSGLDEGSGEYFVRIGVGSPPKEQFVVIDSGSDIVWVQCQPCTQCYAQSDPVFDPADSASFAGISCNSRICDIAGTGAGSASCGGSGRCLYEVSYGDGSYTKGTLALETLTFRATAVRNVAIGCGHRNRGLFTGAAGLLGLGWGPMSFVGQLGGQVGGGLQLLPRESGVRFDRFYSLRPELGRPGRRGLGTAPPQPPRPKFLLRGPLRSRGRRREVTARGRALPIKRGRRRGSGDGHRHGGDETAGGRVRGAAGCIRGGGGGVTAGGGGVDIRHMLRPGRVRERAGADRVILFFGRHDTDAAGTELANTGGRIGEVLFCVCSILVEDVDIGEYSAGRDSDYVGFCQWFCGVWAYYLLANNAS